MARRRLVLNAVKELFPRFFGYASERFADSSLRYAVLRMGIMVKKCWSIDTKVIWTQSLTRTIVEGVQQWWCLMAKKALSGLLLCRGATIWQESTSKAALAVHSVWLHIYLEQQHQQASAPTDLVQALDHRRLHPETIGQSEWSQYQYSATDDSILARASSREQHRFDAVSLPDFGRNLSRPTQRSFCSNVG